MNNTLGRCVRVCALLIFACARNAARRLTEMLTQPMSLPQSQHIACMLSVGISDGMQRKKQQESFLHILFLQNCAITPHSPNTHRSTMQNVDETHSAREIERFSCENIEL